MKAFRDRSYDVITTAQVLDMAEEVGEFVGAFRRFQGLARRGGSRADLEEEWADVIIAAFSAACFLDIDPVKALHAKAQKVMSRGYREG